MILSRRELFKNLKDNLLENLQSSIPFFLNSNLTGDIPQIIESSVTESTDLIGAKSDSWISLGNISDFPPDYSTTVNNGRHIVISKAEGVYVLDSETYKAKEKEPRRLIRFGKSGIIMMNIIDTCPVGTVLSVLTGELVIEEKEEI